MPLDLTLLIANIPIVGGAVGIVGGTIGAVAGIAGFVRRTLRLVVTVTQNNDAHSSWHTVTTTLLFLRRTTRKPTSCFWTCRKFSVGMRID